MTKSRNRIDIFCYYIGRMLTFIMAELYLIAAITLLFVLHKIRRAYKNFRFKPLDNVLTDDELPSVSVCLPARNENNSMTECLESVLASNYPKMEVIVLDDASSDNTSHLIKAFAHAGVRFVAGKPRPSDWLGKNFALETLLEESSGKYVLFMDVDTRLSPTAIRSLVEKIAHDNLAMISVIPQRYDTFRASTWFSTLRNFWELVLDSKYRPGSSSAAWLVDRKMLADELGGFEIWRDDVQPELYIANEVAKTDQHRLIVSTPELGVRFEKKWSSQIETGRRTLLPRFGNSILSVLVGVGLLCLIVLPQLVVILSWVEGWWEFLWIQLALGVIASVIFAYYCRLVWRNRWWIGFFVAPYVAWQEIFLMISSIIGYKRGTITWKGRRVDRPTRKGLSY